MLVLGLMGMGAHCQRGGPLPGTTGGSTHALDERPADPAHRAAWDQLEAARADDPGGDSVRTIADEILAQSVPDPVRLAALRAKAEHAYLNQLDAQAVTVADEGLALVEIDPTQAPQVIVEIARIRARALVRGGDPSLAVQALDDPLVHARGDMEPVELAGLRAVAADRNGDHKSAVAAFATWRDLLSEADPTTAWVEDRLIGLSAALGPDDLAEVAEALPDSPARACLRARLGQAPAPGSPSWVDACRAAAGGVGVLLPRSGPFAAFADEHLAATLATMEVLSSEGSGSQPGQPTVVWRDSGSSHASARRAAQSLLADGARVLVGPIGPKNVDAVTDEAQSRATVIVPGETRGSAIGVAASLERRVQVLMAAARAQGRTRIVVLAPDNGYGRRAVEAAQATPAGRSESPLVVHTYPPKTTSFGPHVTAVESALRKGEVAAVLIPDTLSRAELVVRQLSRAGHVPDRDGAPGLMVLTTAEGLGPAPLARAREVLEGVWVVPAAARGPQAEAFERAYERQQGELPGDQALLVFYALQQAITGRRGPGAGAATLTRVLGGRLVAQPAPS